MVVRSPGKRFESLLNKFSKEMESGTIGYADLSSESTAGTSIVFKVLRERSRDKIFSSFVEALKESVKGTISFETTVVDIDHKVLVKSIDDMLLDTYTMFTTANEEMLKVETKHTIELIDEYNTLEKIREPLSTCIRSNNFSITQTIERIFDTTGVEKDIIKDLISKYRIQKLLTLNTDTTELQEKKKEFQDKLKNLPKFVLEQYNTI